MENGINHLGHAPGNETVAAAAEGGLERKFAQFGEGLAVVDGTEISGYASLFGDVDQGGDVVQAGAYGTSLKAIKAAGRSIKMLWQHDPAQPIGVWDEVREDSQGPVGQGTHSE